MDHNKIADTCRKAATLIRRDGFTRGGSGWLGAGGWCLEGALMKALGWEMPGTVRDTTVIFYGTGPLSSRLNTSEVGTAIRQHLGIAGSLYGWNDMHTVHEVLDVLDEVAEYHTGMEVKAALEDATKVIEAMGEAGKVATITAEEYAVAATKPVTTIAFADGVLSVDALAIYNAAAPEEEAPLYVPQEWANGDTFTIEPGSLTLSSA